MSEAVACAACGAATLSEVGAGEVCRVCGWADAAEARRDPERPEAGAGVSLSEAQRNVARYGQAFPPAEAGGQ